MQIYLKTRIDNIVYFISDSKSSFIKIGYTSQKIEERLKQLGTGNHDKLYVIGYINDGDKSLERTLHKRFVKHNLEWFDVLSSFNDGLLDYINTNNDKNVYVELNNGVIQMYDKIKLVL